MATTSNVSYSVRTKGLSAGLSIKLALTICSPAAPITADVIAAMGSASADVPSDPSEPVLDIVINEKTVADADERTTLYLEDDMDVFSFALCKLSVASRLDPADSEARMIKSAKVQTPAAKAVPLLPAEIVKRRIFIATTGELLLTPQTPRLAAKLAAIVPETIARR